MSGDGQRGPCSGGTADRGRLEADRRGRTLAGRVRQATVRTMLVCRGPTPLIPALDEGQLAALREIGREWDRVSADPQVWQQALPVDPSLDEYPEASQVRPALFTRFVPVAGQDGQLPPIEPRAFPRRRSRRWPGRPGTEAAGLRLTAGRQRERGGADAQARGATGAVGRRAVLGRLRATAMLAVLVMAGPACRTRWPSARRSPPWWSRGWCTPRAVDSTPSRFATWPSDRPLPCSWCCARPRPAPRP